MTEEDEPPRWMVEFFAALIETGSVRQAVEEAGIDFESAWALRETAPAFAHFWDKAVRVHRSGALLALADIAAGREDGVAVH